MFEDGIRYPTRGENAFGRIIIGGVLSFLSFLLLPAVPLFGYLLRVLEGSAYGDAEPPEFEDWGALAKDGLKALVVVLAYGIVPFALIGATLGLSMVGAASGSDAAAGILGGIGFVGFLVTLVGMVLLYYLVPAALTNVAVEGNVGAAFDFDTLSDVLLSVDYLLAWLLPFVVGLLANVLTVALVMVTFGLGGLVVPFVQFYVQVSIFYMFGRAFGKVRGLERADASPTVPGTSVD